MERVLIVYPSKHWVEIARTGLRGREIEIIEKYDQALKHLASSPPYDAVCCGLDDLHTIPIFEKALEISATTRLIPIVKKMEQVVEFALKWRSDPARVAKHAAMDQFLLDPLSITDIPLVFPPLTEDGLHATPTPHLTEKAAANDRPVLIEGEPGTGKRTLAEQIHQLSARGKSGGPFRVVHCGPGGADEWLSGGTRNGGAEKLRYEVFPAELAEGGSLVLANIEQLQPSAQLGLLEFLEDPTTSFVRPVGSGQVPVDLRVMATANRSLRPSLGDRFAGELFYRLSQNYIRMPSLREHQDGIERLARDLLNRLRGLDIPSAAPRSTGTSTENAGELFTPAALSVIKRYNWPGNFDELKFALTYADLRSIGTIDIPHLPPWIVNAAARRDW